MGYHKTTNSKQKPQKKKRLRTKKNIVAIEIACSILLALLLLVGGINIYRLIGNNISSLDGESHLVYIYPNTNLDSLITSIEKDYTIASVRSIRFHGKLMGWPKEGQEFVRTGCYKIPARMANLELIRMLRNGQQTPIHISFRNIRTPEQLASRLADQLMIDSTAIIERLQSEEYMASYGLTPPTAVTLFLPDTYEIWWDISADQLFKRMQKEYNNFWNEERKEKAMALGLEPWEIATIASIVEEETNKDVDKPIIAGLYMNRLRIGMPLQSCPTVKFALRDFTLRRITNQHLAVESPYNTYKHTGLPPGPIRIPTKQTLDFTLNPVESNYLYMCASDQFDGTHHFSTNYAAHAAYARAYQRALNKRGIH